MNTVNRKQLPHEIILGRLKQMGLGKIEVSHFRRNKGDGEYRPSYYYRDARMQYAIDSKGGSTVVSVVINNSVVLGAVADCSKNDVFNRRQGLTIALRRLYKKVLENKDQIQIERIN
jgi:hypothetical protein